LNDARIIYKVFGNNLEFIKYRLVLRVLGLGPYLSCLMLNYGKGIFLLMLTDSKEDFIGTIIALLLLLGNYLGAKPGKTGGSEIIVLWGIWSGYNFSLVQTPLAIFIGIWLITHKLKYGFWIASIIIVINLLIIKSYYMFSLSILILLNYAIIKLSLFLPLINKMKEKLIIGNLKGVKIL